MLGDGSLRKLWSIWLIFTWPLPLLTVPANGVWLKGHNSTADIQWVISGPTRVPSVVYLGSGSLEPGVSYWAASLWANQ